MKDIARRSALKILNLVDGSQKPLDAVMEEILPEGRFPSKRDRAFIQTIVYGVLRWRGRIDWIINHFSNIKLQRIDPKVFYVIEQARDMGINYIGICCGAGPHHVRAMAEALGRTVPASQFSPEIKLHPIFGDQQVQRQNYVECLYGPMPKEKQE